MIVCPVLSIELATIRSLANWPLGFCNGYCSADLSTFIVINPSFMHWRWRAAQASSARRLPRVRWTMLETTERTSDSDPKQDGTELRPVAKKRPCAEVVITKRPRTCEMRTANLPSPANRCFLFSLLRHSCVLIFPRFFIPGMF